MPQEQASAPDLPVIDELVPTPRCNSPWSSTRSRITRSGQSSLKLSERTRSSDARPPRLNDRFSHRVHTADCLHRDGFARGVLHPHLNRAVRVLTVKLQDINQIRTVREPATSNRQLFARAQSVAEWRLLDSMRRILCCAQPYVIDLRPNVCRSTDAPPTGPN